MGSSEVTTFLRAQIVRRFPSPLQFQAKELIDTNGIASQPSPIPGVLPWAAHHNHLCLCLLASLLCSIISADFFKWRNLFPLLTDFKSSIISAWFIPKFSWDSLPRTLWFSVSQNLRIYHCRCYRGYIFLPQMLSDWLVFAGFVSYIIFHSYWTIRMGRR